jgi:hypothetical protein
MKTVDSQKIKKETVSTNRSKNQIDLTLPGT